MQYVLYKAVLTSNKSFVVIFLFTSVIILNTITGAFVGKEACNFVKLFEMFDKIFFKNFFFRFSPNIPLFDCFILCFKVLYFIVVVDVEVSPLPGVQEQWKGRCSILLTCTCISIVKIKSQKKLKTIIDNRRNKGDITARGEAIFHGISSKFVIVDLCHRYEQ